MACHRRVDPAVAGRGVHGSILLVLVYTGRYGRLRSPDLAQWGLRTLQFTAQTFWLPPRIFLVSNSGRGLWRPHLKQDMVTELLPRVKPPKAVPGALAVYLSRSLEIVVLVSLSRVLMGSRRQGIMKVRVDAKISRVESAAA